MHDVRSAIEAAGLDPAVGFFTGIGRAAGPALDLMEDRPVTDRLPFPHQPAEGSRQRSRRWIQARCLMNNDTRKTVTRLLSGAQAGRDHAPVLGEKDDDRPPLHVQALPFLARRLRGASTVTRRSLEDQKGGRMLVLVRATTWRRKTQRVPPPRPCGRTCEDYGQRCRFRLRVRRNQPNRQSSNNA